MEFIILKPCSCGEADIYISSRSSQGLNPLPEHNNWEVRCPSCGNSGPPALSMNQAATNWNDSDD